MRQKNELNEMTTEYCNRDVAFRPKKRRRKFTFISPLFALILFLLIAKIAFVKGAAFAFGEDDDAGRRRRKLESDVVDARRRTRTTTANDESGRLMKSARELAFEAHAKRQARTNEKMRETTGARRRLVFQRDVVAVSDSDDEGAFARKKAELFKTKTKSSKSTRDGTDGVDDQTETTTDGEEGEEEILSRERLLRRRGGRKAAANSGTSAQNVVQWNFASSAFAREPKEYADEISSKRSRRKRSDGGVGGRTKDYFNAVNEDATASQQFYVVLEEGETDTSRAEQILRKNRGGFLKDSNGFPLIVVVEMVDTSRLDLRKRLLKFQKSQRGSTRGRQSLV